MNVSSLSVIIPVLHEEENILVILDHIRRVAEDQAVEIIVVDGDPGGSTLEIIRDDTVQKILAPRGRARQMNAGAAAARGDILLFLHADTRLPEQAFQAVRDHLTDVCRAGAFRLKIDSPRLFLKTAAAFTNIRSGCCGTPYGDQAQFFLRSYFEQIGGYKNIPLFEDLEIMQRIRRRGEKIILLPQKVLTSARRWEQEGMVYGTLRNRVISFLFNIGVSPQKLVQYYRNHKQGKS